VKHIEAPDKALEPPAFGGGSMRVVKPCQDIAVRRHMKVLTIGATGFIGRHAVPLLVAQGIEVAVLHRGETDAPPRALRR